MQRKHLCEETSEVHEVTCAWAEKTIPACNYHLVVTTDVIADFFVAHYLVYEKRSTLIVILLLPNVPEVSEEILSDFLSSKGRILRMTAAWLVESQNLSGVFG